MSGVLNIQDPVRTNAHAEVVAIPAPSVDEIQMPDGAVQLTYLCPDGSERRSEVTLWKRLDQGVFQPGLMVQVDVQARRARDLRLPVHHESRRVMLTHDPADKVQFLVGDPTGPAGWGFGVVLRGAILD